MRRYPARLPAADTLAKILFLLPAWVLALVAASMIGRVSERASERESCQGSPAATTHPMLRAGRAVARLEIPVHSRVIAFVVAHGLHNTTMAVWWERGEVRFGQALTHANRVISSAKFNIIEHKYRYKNCAR